MNSRLLCGVEGSSIVQEQGGITREEYDDGKLVVVFPGNHRIYIVVFLGFLF